MAQCSDSTPGTNAWTRARTRAHAHTHTHAHTQTRTHAHTHVIVDVRCLKANKHTFTFSCVLIRPFLDHGDPDWMMYSIYGFPDRVEDVHSETGVGSLRRSLRTLRPMTAAFYDSLQTSISSSSILESG